MAELMCVDCGRWFQGSAGPCGPCRDRAIALAGGPEPRPRQGVGECPMPEPSTGLRWFDPKSCAGCGLRPFDHADSHLCNDCEDDRIKGWARPATLQFPDAGSLWTGSVSDLMGKIQAGLDAYGCGSVDDPGEDDCLGEFISPADIAIALAARDRRHELDRASADRPQGMLLLERETTVALAMWRKLTDVERAKYESEAVGLLTLAREAGKR